jgi:membrane-bound serine protease (ClpP class)
MAVRRLVEVLILLSCLAGAVVHAQPAGQPYLIDIKGGIGPATADHMIRGLEQAHENNAGFVILQIDTPGGLDTSMRDMIKAILAANIPVVGFVAPGGARAASAGTYILYATHIAAMAPGTNLGAATPVQIGAPSMPQLPSKSPEEEGGPNTNPTTAMERKVVNDAVAYIQSMAQMRGRNGDWAELAVREGASLAAADALADNVIDLMAESVEDLLPQLHGRQVTINGVLHTLDAHGQSVFVHEIDWRSEFLSVITDPNVAYMLMLIGIYGMIFEFYNPGVGVPGVVGAVCLLVALYAFQVLPISYAGLALMLLGIGLMTAEALSPSFGILGLGGIVAFVIGSIILMDTELPGYQIALPMIIAFAAFSAGILIFALGMVVRARKQAVVSGLDHLLGTVAMVETVRGGSARVRLDGELWQVNCDELLSEEDAVTVTGIDGITLHVTRKNGGRDHD